MKTSISRRQMLQSAVAATVFAGHTSTWLRPTMGASRTPRGLALCLGLNNVQASSYAGYVSPLGGCINDCNNMKRLASSQGFDTISLVDGDAKIQTVRNHIKWAAHLLKPGDIFLLSCSSHGSQRTDRNQDEPDRKDETLCLWDGQWIDDDRLQLFTRFARGVRILFIVDACHSASTAKVIQAEDSFDDSAELAEDRPRGVGDGPPRNRQIDNAEADVQDSILEIKDSDDLAKYKEMLKKSPEVPRDIGNPVDFGTQFNLPEGLTSPVRALPDELAAYLSQFPSPFDQSQPSARSLSAMRAGVLTLAACQDDELAWDNGREGLFTRALLGIWNGGRFDGDYTTFFEAVAEPLRRVGRQHPSKDVFGDTDEFLKETPFSIG